MKRALFVVGSVAASCLLPGTALANGRFPAAGQLAVAPNDPSFLVLRTTFGLVVSHDTGATWDWICESAAGFVDEDPFLALTSHAILGATSKGLAVSPDAGCGWAFATGALTNQIFVDLAVAPTDPANAIALATAYTGEADGGGSLYASQIFRTTNGGTDWVANGPPVDPTALVDTLDVARSDPRRVYVSIIRGLNAAATAALLVSTDGGLTWTERAMPFDGITERGVFIAAVDPTNADRVYVRTSGTASRLFVTDDAGKAFRVVLATEPMAGFALSSDGATVFVGGASGLQVAAATDLAFAKVSPIAVQCLMYVGSTLYACSDEASGFIVGASKDAGKSFTPLLHLRDVRGPLACPPMTSAAACVAEWPAIRDQIGADAGVLVDAGGPMTNPPTATPSPTNSACGCTASRGRSISAIAVALLLATAAWMRRGRRRERGPD